MNNFIIPSIDLLNGEIIRLVKGDYNQKTVYDIAIEELLQKYKNFANLHVVNLNGAKGEKISDISFKFRGKVQLGGGIRGMEIAEKALQQVDRIVLGTIAINNIELTTQIIDKFGAEKVVLALDVIPQNDNFVLKSNGWLETSEKKLFNILKSYEMLAKYILVTDISVDGTMGGPNIELYKQIKQKFPNFILQASGGVGTIEHIKKLQKVADNAIVGKALYEGLIDDLC